MFCLQPRPRSPRRGVTLIEMLVTVALLILIMTVIVQIFSAATGAMSGAKVYQELDGSLRQIDATIRTDLAGVTAKLTPPLNPNLNLGYFEYGENAFADLQGEDTDDYLRFTAQAPEGQPFTGRVWVGPLYVPSPPAANTTTPVPAQPILVSSQYAEIIYFLRNGNLYRRVLLIAPERQNTINITSPIFYPSMLGNSAVSWQGVNDLSAHPSPTGNAINPIVLNTLGHLTNRENRYASPRFCSDYVTHGTPGTWAPDGLPDDENKATIGPNTTAIGDSVPDFYPTLYPGVFSPTNTLNSLIFDYNSAGTYTTASRYNYSATNYAVMPFPFIFPGMYSKPDPYSAANGLGWIHSVNPGTATAAPNLAALMAMNHAPIDLGDSLPFPPSADSQTWWGFPTWRETLLTLWNDPYTRVNLTSTPLQPTALTPLNPSTYPPSNPLPSPATWLPPVLTQPNNDSYGSTTWAVPLVAWEDDLILNGVRSFDVKAYDNAFGGYADLGWGDDLRLYSPYGTPPANPPYLQPTAAAPSPLAILWPPVGGTTYNLLNGSFAHEGRIPPLQGDNRYNPVFPVMNVGDDHASVIRLRRVWDSWSTDYSNAPSVGFDPSTNFPTGPPFTAPVYPSYPPPYPAPLRGIQIQIRVVDPRNQKLKTLTIRQDFSDKL